MMAFGIVVWLTAVPPAVQLPVPPAVSGFVPAGLDSPARVSWLPAETETPEAGCILVTPQQWTCSGLPAGARGIVAISGINSVGFVVLGPAGDTVASVAKWGRLVRVTPGGVAPEDLSEMTITAWKPGRSRARPQSKRFTPVRDSAVHIRRVSASAFWITSDAAASDGFLLLQGPAIATGRVATLTAATGPPELPLFVSAGTPSSIRGRAERTRGDPVDGADVELFTALVETDSSQRPAPQGSALVRAAVTRTEGGGGFEFHQLESGSYLVVVRDPALGRGEAWTSTAESDVVVKVIAPTTATGRVLRRHIPVAGARVRFVPDRVAWGVSVDPTEHITTDTYTDDSGRFVLRLPPKTTGSLQIIDADGASIRVPVTGTRDETEIRLGDVTVPDPSRAVVRLLNREGCDLVAVGPVGDLGLTTVRPINTSNVYWFELPEPGTWALYAECSGHDYEVDPPFINSGDGATPQVDARLVEGRDR